MSTLITGLGGFVGPHLLRALPDRFFPVCGFSLSNIPVTDRKGVTCEKVEMDFSVGGEYQIFMQTKDGPMTAYGEYKKIEQNQLISFTWGWRQNDLEGTLVTISLREVDEGTELTLEHTGFPQQDIADHHNMGWTSICEKLDQFLSD